MLGTVTQKNPKLEEAILLHQSGNLAAAEPIYREIIEQAPTTIEAYLNLAYALSGLNRLNEAIPVLENGLAVNEKQVDLMVTLSGIYANIGNIQKGLEISKEAVNLYPENGHAHYSLANLSVNLGMTQDALFSYQETIKLIPDFAEAYHNLALLYHNLSQMDEAKNMYLQAISKSSNLIPSYLNLGLIYNQEQNFLAAIDIFQQAVTADPEYAATYKLLGTSLHITGKLEEAHISYSKAFEKGLDDVELNVLMGNVLRDLGQEKASASYYEKALKQDPDNKIAKENLEKMRKQLISNWHFDMLADTARNEAYDKALKKNVKQNDYVLDIGAGSGLLSMMALRAGAENVVGCEMVPSLADAAQRIVKSNKMDDKISIFNKKSTSLEIGKELDKRATLLVSEILDMGVLGEGVIPSLRHAQKNLLTPDATIIPKQANIKGILINSPHLEGISPIGNISGFDLSIFDEFRIKTQYNRKYLNAFPHKALSEVTPIININFYHLPAPAAEDQPNVSEVEFTATESGKVHGIAFWFDLHLDDETTVCSGPDGEMIHWGQAVFSFDKEIHVTKGETIKVKALQSDLMLRFEY